jgi:hypothetical protein
MGLGRRLNFIYSSYVLLLKYHYSLNNYEGVAEEMCSAKYLREYFVSAQSSRNMSTCDKMSDMASYHGKDDNSFK